MSVSFPQRIPQGAIRGGVLALGVGFLLAPSVAARENGITGFSGKDGIICSACHFSAIAAPTVTLQGPRYLRPLETGVFGLLIQGGNETGGGLNVAVDVGALASTHAGTQLLNDEITHLFPQPVNGDQECFWDFELTAPATPQTLTMWGAGNSVNLNGFNTGDIPHSDMMSIEVREDLITFDRYGTGTAGSGGFTPELVGSNGPMEGGAEIQIRSGLGDGLGFLLIGVAPECLVGLGGKFLVDLSQSFVFQFLPLDGSPGVPGDGFLDVVLGDFSTVPDDTELFLQYLAADPMAPRGRSFSNGTSMLFR